MKADITTDLYFAVQAIESDELRELGRKLKQTPYRKLATFPANLEKMDSLPIGKIALLNYLTDRLTQRQFRQEASLAIEHGASEIELYWVESFFSWGSAKWQQLIEELANEGVVLRVMLDVVLLDEEQLTKVLGFLRSCGVTDVGVSSGTMPDIVTPTQWRDYQRLFPSIFRLKVVGVKSKADADAFRSAGIRFIGTRELT